MRDLACVASRGRLLVSGSVAHASLETAVSNTTAVTAILPGQGRKVVPQKMFDDYLIQPHVM